MKIRTGLALGATLAVLVVSVPLSAQLFGLLDPQPDPARAGGWARRK